MKNLFIAILLVVSLFLSGCASLNALAKIAGLAVAGYGIYAAVESN